MTSSGFLSLVGYIGVFYGFVLDYAFYGETISVAECFGALVILAVTIGVSYYKVKVSK
jgi:drug/metabolite transporter (DMT)-like permease